VSQQHSTSLDVVKSSSLAPFFRRDDLTDSILALYRSSSKVLWLLGYLLLVGFNIGIGFSSSAVVFDVLRALAGVGTAFVVPNAIALLSKQYEPGIQRTIAFSSFGALAPIGFQVHAVFASLVTERIGPRWIFWLE